MSRGGKRDGAGRPKGAKSVITEEAIRRAGEGETPLEYMLRVMRDSTVEQERRDRMAIGAAPYMHAKAVEVSGPDGGAIPVSPFAVNVLKSRTTSSPDQSASDRSD